MAGSLLKLYSKFASLEGVYVYFRQDSRASGALPATMPLAVFLDLWHGVYFHPTWTQRQGFWPTEALM